MKHNIQTKKCVNCNRPLTKHRGAWMCIPCNPEAVDVSDIFVEDIESNEFTFVECPGATMYDPETNEVIEGVHFIDRDDPSKGHKIIGKSIYAPNHKKRRRVRKEDAGSVRRCQACQDYTVRCRRKEGRDFYIPSSKHPERNKLKSMEHVAYEPR